MRPYSRYATLEEKRNIRKAFVFGVLTIGLIILLFTFGLSTLAKFAGMIADLRGSSKPIEKVDITPPGPPHINTLPLATNKKSLEITGTSEPGATVTLYLGDKTHDVVADSDGNFSYTFDLDKGDNTISAMAKDSAGNESKKTPVYTVTYDTEPPTLDISQPNDGASFSGPAQRQLTISGKVTPGTTLTVNDRFVMVTDDGSFTYLTTLSDGQNTFNLKAIDAAGNTTEKSLTVSFSS